MLSASSGRICTMMLDMCSSSGIDGCSAIPRDADRGGWTDRNAGAAAGAAVERDCRNRRAAGAPKKPNGPIRAHIGAALAQDAPFGQACLRNLGPDVPGGRQGAIEDRDRAACRAIATERASAAAEIDFRRAGAVKDQDMLGAG